MTVPQRRAIALALDLEPTPTRPPAAPGFVLEFEVRGKPVTQGDLTRSPRGGLYHKHRTELEAWRLRIASAADEAMAGLPPWLGAVAVELDFRIVRPAGHYLPVNRSRPVRELRPDAPAHPTTIRGGDIDKLTRASLDALSDVAYSDDSQVVDVHVWKRFAGEDEGQGVKGSIRSLEDAAEPRNAGLSEALAAALQAWLDAGDDGLVAEGRLVDVAGDWLAAIRAGVPTREPGGPS